MKQISSKWQRMAVIGAAGKMGRGIAALLLQEMAWQELKQQGDLGTGAYRLVLMDPNEDELFQLRRYLRGQLIRFAEKKIAPLRECFAGDSTLVSNKEIIETFVNRGLDMVQLGTRLSCAEESLVVMEAVTEDPSLKVELLKQCPKEAWIYTNTSSIPIEWLAEKSELIGRLMGLHFYNPPPMQHVVEWVAPNGVDKSVVNFGLEIGKLLKKTMVESSDVAGFIGNGHFIREAAFACERVKELAKGRSINEAVSLLDSITRDLLLRPMGIFELMDFIGLDVCKAIAKVMSEHLGESLVIDIELKGKPERVDLEKPENWQPWKSYLKNHPDAFQPYFGELKKLNDEAIIFLKKSQEIAKKLIGAGVVKSEDDLKEVLTKGFHHLYSPLEIEV